MKAAVLGRRSVTTGVVFYMNRRVIIYCGSLLAALLIGFLAGHYVAAIGCRYREAYFSVSGGLFRLHCLDRGWTDKIRQEAGLGIIGGSALIDSLPGWARQYSPARSSESLPEAWLKIVHELKLAESRRSHMSHYGLNESDINRILTMHFHVSNSKEEKMKNNTEPAHPAEPSQSSGR